MNPRVSNPTAKKVFVTSENIFVNTSAVVIEYHDVLRAQWFSMLAAMVKGNIMSEIFDLSSFQGMSAYALFEWYVNRKHRNFFMDLPLSGKYQDFPSEEEKQEFMDYILFDSTRVRDLYRMQFPLNMSTVLKKLFMTARDIVKHFYIYGGEHRDEFMEEQLEEDFRYAHTCDFIYGDFKHAIANLNTDTTYILSDITKVSELEEMGRISMSSILIADGFRYNSKIDDPTTLKVDISEIQRKYTCRCTLFNNLFVPEN